VSRPVTAKHTGLLYELGCAFAAKLELAELVSSVIARCREVLDTEGVAVLLLDDEAGELYFPFASQRDPDVEKRLAALRFPADRGIAGAVLSSGKAELIDDVTADPRFYAKVDESTGLTTCGLLAAPLIGRRGPIGVIQIVNQGTGARFTQEDLAFLEALAASVAIAIDNARMYGDLKANEERLRTEVGALRRDIAKRDRFSEMIAAAPSMDEVFRLMEAAAASPIAVLIEGETGTGKELVARGIHHAGERASSPFLAVNCAALPAELLESELFGHCRGAFTGATKDRRGLFEAGSGGTIFLDEIGEMPLAMQPKLLRVLQEGEVTPVGMSSPRKVDVRIISATNRSLEDEVTGGGFREDLYFRLSPFPIKLPGLRDRREDIPLLAHHFVEKSAARHGKRIAGIEPAAIARLTAFTWRGNIRELENEIERAVALTLDGEPIRTDTLSPKLEQTAGLTGKPAPRPALGRTAIDFAAPSALADGTPPGSSIEPLKSARAAFEARYIGEALQLRDGNVSRTAEALGLSRVMLQKKMKEYGLRKTREQG